MTSYDGVDTGLKQKKGVHAAILDDSCTHAYSVGTSTLNPYTGRRSQDADANEMFSCGLASGDVESHFHVQGDLSDLGLCPGHVVDSFG